MHVIDDIIDNMQTRQIAGLDCFEGPCNEMMFERAVQNLNAARFVGVQSDLKRVEAHMEAAFGWAPVTVKNSHVSTKPMLRFIDDELFSKIYHCESFDARLYNIASRLAAQ